MRGGKGKEETGVDGKPGEGERRGGMKGRGQGGDRGCGYKLPRVRPWWTTAPWREEHGAAHGASVAFSLLAPQCGRSPTWR